MSEAYRSMWESLGLVDRILATGYGRHLFELALDAPTVTEIKAYAMGAGFLFPEVRTILDIGGQDSKAIALRGNGRVKKFEMNDRCAAGTGKFLEIMAHSLGYALEAFGRAALKAEREIQVSSMCTAVWRSTPAWLGTWPRPRGKRSWCRSSPR